MANFPMTNLVQSKGIIKYNLKRATLPYDHSKGVVVHHKMRSDFDSLMLIYRVMRNLIFGRMKGLENIRKCSTTSKAIFLSRVETDFWPSCFPDAFLHHSP